MSSWVEALLAGPVFMPACPLMMPANQVCMSARSGHHVHPVGADVHVRRLVGSDAFL